MRQKETPFASANARGADSILIRLFKVFDRFYRHMDFYSFTQLLGITIQGMIEKGDTKRPFAERAVMESLKRFAAEHDQTFKETTLDEFIHGEGADILEKAIHKRKIREAKVAKEARKRRVSK